MSPSKDQSKMYVDASNFRGFIEMAKFRIEEISDPFHNIVHIESVVDTTSFLARLSGADEGFMTAAAWWHDVGRAFTDVGHEKKSAEMAVDAMKSLGYE